MSRDLTLTIVFAAAMSILQTSQAANRELVDIAQVEPARKIISSNFVIG